MSLPVVSPGVWNRNAPAYLCLSSPRYRSVNIVEGSDYFEDAITAADLVHEFDLPWPAMKFVIEKAKMRSVRHHGQVYYEYGEAEVAIRLYGPPAGSVNIDVLRRELGISKDTIYKAVNAGALASVWAECGVEYYPSDSYFILVSWMREESDKRKAKLKAERQEANRLAMIRGRKKAQKAKAVV